jgi:hypothetical protein
MLLKQAKILSEQNIESDWCPERVARFITQENQVGELDSLRAKDGYTR